MMSSRVVLLLCTKVNWLFSCSQKVHILLITTWTSGKPSSRAILHLMRDRFVLQSFQTRFFAGEIGYHLSLQAVEYITQFTYLSPDQMYQIKSGRSKSYQNPQEHKICVCDNTSHFLSLNASVKATQILSFLSNNSFAVIPRISKTVRAMTHITVRSTCS